MVREVLEFDTSVFMFIYNSCASLAIHNHKTGSY